MTFGIVFRLLEKRISYMNEFITAAKKREKKEEKHSRKNEKNTTTNNNNNNKQTKTKKQKTKKEKDGKAKKEGRWEIFSRRTKCLSLVTSKKNNLATYIEYKCFHPTRKHASSERACHGEPSVNTPASFRSRLSLTRTTSLCLQLLSNPLKRFCLLAQRFR